MTKLTRERLGAEFHFDPAQHVQQEPSDTDDGVFVLPVMTVTQSMQRRDLEQAVAKSEREWEARRYSMVRGGAIFEKEFHHAKVELGTWSAGPGLGFLKISW